MLTAQLQSYIQRYQYFSEKRISITPDQAYLGGSWAQQEICNELMPLEKKITLQLIATQEEYQFTPATVSGATATSPVQLTVTGHPFNTGDTVFVASVGGITGASGYFTATKVNANTISLNGSTGTGTYTSGGMVYHGLSAAVDIKNIARTIAPYGAIKRKLIQTVESERGYFTDASGEDISGGVAANSYDVVYEDPIRLAFRPVPTTSQTVNVIIYRRPLPPEALSATVNPILTPQFDKTLYLGALCQVFDLLQLEEAESVIAKVRSDYEMEKDRQKTILANARKVRKEIGRTFKW